MATYDTAITLSESITVDTSADSTTPVIQVNDSSVISRYNFSTASLNTDFAIYVEVPKWNFFNSGTDWEYLKTPIVDPGTGQTIGTILSDAHDPSGATLNILANPLLANDNLKNIIKNFDNNARFIHFQQCSKFYNYAFKVGNPISVPVFNAAGAAVNDASGQQYTRNAQLYAVYVNPVTGEPLPYSSQIDANTRIFYYMDAASQSPNPFSTIADSTTLRVTNIDGSAIPVTSVVPPHPDYPKKVPDSSGQGDNNYAYWANLAKTTVYELPPAKMSGTTGVTTGSNTQRVNNVMVDGLYSFITSSLPTTGSSHGAMAMDKDYKSMWTSSSVFYTASSAVYNGSTTSNFYYRTSSGGTIVNSGPLQTVSGEWVQLQMPSSIYLKSYTVTPVIANFGPTKFTLIGYVGENDTTGIFLDSRSNVDWSGNVPITFQVSTYPYSPIIKVRLVMEATNGSNYCGINELRFTDYNGTQYPNVGMNQDTTTVSGSTYIASTSSTLDGLVGAYKAFDWDAVTYYMSAARYSWNGVPHIITANSENTRDCSAINNYGAFLSIFCPQPVDVVSYSITTSGIFNAPMDWKLYGSYYTSDFWVLLDSRTNILDWTTDPLRPGTSTKTFTVPALDPSLASIKPDVPFNAYRLVVTKIANGTSLAVVEVRLNGKISSFPDLRLPPATISSGGSLTVTGGNYLLEGTYTASVSSVEGGSFASFPFDYNPNQRWSPLDSLYYATATHTGASITVDASTNTGYSGEWLQLRCPSGVQVKSIKIASVLPSNGGGAPAYWSLLGSNDGLLWRYITASSVYGSGMVAASGTGITFPIPMPSGGYVPYSYYRLVVHELVGRCSGSATPTMYITEMSLTDASASNAQYPPGAMNASSTTLSGGTYVATSSINSASGYLAFDGVTTTSLLINSRYTSIGNYRGNVTTRDLQNTTYSGEWVQLQLPTAVSLTSYVMYANSGKEPGSWVILGSNDASGWTLVHQVTSPSAIVAGAAVRFPGKYVVTSPPASGFTYYRCVVTKANTNDQVGINELNFFGRVTGRTMPGNDMVWSPPALYLSASGVNQMCNMSADPSRAMLLFWDVGPVWDKPYMGNEQFLAWTSPNYTSRKTIAPLRDLDPSSATYSSDILLAYNKFSYAAGKRTISGGTVYQIRTGIQNQLTSSGAPKLCLPLSYYKAKTVGSTKLIPFSYDSANSVAVFGGDSGFTNVGGRVMQLLTHYLFNGITDTEATTFMSAIKTESGRVTDALVDGLVSMLSQNNYSSFNARSSFINQILNRYGQQYFDISGTYVTNQDGTMLGQMREVIRAMDDLFLTFNMNVGRRTSWRLPGRGGMIEIRDIPIIMRLKSSIFEDGRGPAVMLDAGFVYTTSGALSVTGWPNLAGRSMWSAGYGQGYDKAYVDGSSGFVSPSSLSVSVTAGSGLLASTVSLPCVTMTRASNSGFRLQPSGISTAMRNAVNSSGLTFAMVYSNNLSAYPSGDTGSVLLNVPSLGTVQRVANSLNMNVQITNGAGTQSTATAIANGFGTGFGDTTRRVLLWTISPSGGSSMVSTVYINGTQVAQTSVSTPLSASLGTDLNIGFNTPVNPQTFDGNVHQFIMYPRTLTALDISRITTALQGRWYA